MNFLYCKYIQSFVMIVVEDLGIGYCHNQGMGYIGDNVTAKDILGNILHDDNGTVVDIYWTKLVLRPECVDILTIESGSRIFINSVKPLFMGDTLICLF